MLNSKGTIFDQDESSLGLTQGASGPSKKASNASNLTMRRRRRRRRDHHAYSQNNMEGSLSDGELQYSYFEDSLGPLDSDSSDSSDNEDTVLKQHQDNDGISGVVISAIDNDNSDGDGDGDGIPGISLETMNKYGKKVRSRKSSDARRSLDTHPKSNAIQARAIFSYKATNPRELSINVGDIITVTDKSDLDWWSGFLPNGDSGIFPSNYCYVIKKKEKKEKPKKKNPISKFFCGYDDDQEDARRHLVCRCCPQNNEIVLHKMFLYFLLCGVK